MCAIFLNKLRGDIQRTTSSQSAADAFLRSHIHTGFWRITLRSRPASPPCVVPSDSRTRPTSSRDSLPDVMVLASMYTVECEITILSTSTHSPYARPLLSRRPIARTSRFIGKFLLENHQAYKSNCGRVPGEPQLGCFLADLWKCFGNAPKQMLEQWLRSRSRGGPTSMI